MDAEGRKAVLTDADAEFGEYAEADEQYSQAVEERDQQIHRQFGKPGPDELPAIMAELNGEPVEVGARFQDGADGMRVLLADGHYAPLSELKFEDATAQAVYDAAGQYDARGAQAFLRQYTTSVPLKEYSRSFDLFYRSGLEGLSLESAMESFDGFAELIGEQRAVAAYNSGKAQRQAMMEAARSGQASADLSQKNRKLVTNQEQQGEQVTDGSQRVPVGEDLQLDGKSGKIEDSGEGESGAAGKTPSQIARSWQGSGKYPGVDNYRDIILRKGEVVYRGEPNGTEYFTTKSAIETAGKNAKLVFEGLQVEKNPIHGYRGNMKGYMVNEDISAAFGVANANPQFGKGGLPQIFIPNVQDLINKGVLIPVDNIPLLK